MKTPRVKDFDPDAKVPTLKSSMDNMPAIANLKVKKPSLPQAPQREQQKPPPLPKPSTLIQPNKRAFVRRTFDYYEDQIDYLKRESLQEKLAGREVGMNSMIREALDDWIKKKNLQKIALL